MSDVTITTGDDAANDDAAALEAAAAMQAAATDQARLDEETRVRLETEARAQGRMDGAYETAMNQVQKDIGELKIAMNNMADVVQTIAATVTAQGQVIETVVEDLPPDDEAEEIESESVEVAPPPAVEPAPAVEESGKKRHWI